MEEIEDALNCTVKLVLTIRAGKRSVDQYSSRNYSTKHLKARAREHFKYSYVKYKISVQYKEKHTVINRMQKFSLMDNVSQNIWKLSLGKTIGSNVFVSD